MHLLTFFFYYARKNRDGKKSITGRFRVRFRGSASDLARVTMHAERRRESAAVRFPINHRRTGCFPVITGKFEAGTPKRIREYYLYAIKERAFHLSSARRPSRQSRSANCLGIAIRRDWRDSREGRKS